MIQPVAIVLVASFGHGVCKGCRARVVWYRTVGGSWLPFDGHPTPERVRRDETQANAPVIGEIPRVALHYRSCANRPGKAFEKRARS